MGLVLDCFHIDDSEDYPIGTLTDANRVWPGEGVIPLKEILNTLKQIGFNKVATIELFNPQYWEWDVEKTIRTAKQTTGQNVIEIF